MSAPDMAEVERLVSDLIHAVDIDEDQAIEDKARAALLDYVRGVMAERDALMQTLRDEIGENLRLRELGGALPDENITAMTERLIRERDQFRDAAKMVSAAPQPVDEPCRVDQPAGWRCTRANGHKGPCAAVGDRA